MTRLLTVGYLVFITLTLSLPYHAMAQLKPSALAWNPGNVLLDDSTTLKGFIQNDEKFRLIKFKQHMRDTTEFSFPEKRIMSMQYFDSTLSRNRNFYTLEIEDDGSIYRGPVLFEVIMVMKEFVVLARKYGIMPEGKGKTPATIEYDEVEKIFLAGEDSKAELLLLTVLTDGNKSHKQGVPIEPFFDWDVMQKFMGTQWHAVKSYIKNTRLNVYRKPDLLRALEYYQQLDN